MPRPFPGLRESIFRSADAHISSAGTEVIQVGASDQDGMFSHHFEPARDGELKQGG
jgi:hypothetical protein